MSLIFRLLYILFTARSRGPLEIGQLRSRLSLRVLPNDLDISWHMNNGRFLTLCDLSRMDMFVRTGLLKSMRKRKWIPLIGEHTMTYKKPLTLFQHFDLLLEVTHWDEKFFHMKHTFMLGDTVVAHGTSKGCLYAKGSGVVPPEQVIVTVQEDAAQ